MGVESRVMSSSFTKQKRPIVVSAFFNNFSVAVLISVVHCVEGVLKYLKTIAFIISVD